MLQLTDEAGSDLPTPALVPGLGGPPWAPDAPLLPRAGEGERPCGAALRAVLPLPRICGLSAPSFTHIEGRRLRVMPAL